MINEVFNYITLQTKGLISQWPKWFRHYELEPSGFQWSVAFPQTKHLWWCLIRPSSALPVLGLPVHIESNMVHGVPRCGPGRSCISSPGVLPSLVWGQLVHAALWDKAHLILMHPDLGRSAAPLGGCFWHKSDHIFMCNLGKSNLRSKQIQRSKNKDYLSDNEEE